MSAEKIKSRSDLVSITEQLRNEGKRVGLTSGVFDLLHPGHVQYLEDARALCDALIVAVNSDSSVQKLKGLSRPVVTANARAAVVAGLSSVDYVFVFDETNNNQNVTTLKPDLYIKAGDYPLERLSSKPLVESYGGRAMTVPLKGDFSTTAIIEQIVSQAAMVHGALAITPERRPAIFVDRDGTIIEHVEYLHEPEKIRFIAGALEALKAAQDKGYRIVMVTNQPGIGLGYFEKEALFRVNKAILTEASRVGLGFDKLYFCPHSKSDGCPCRKPSTGLIQRAAEELNCDISKSYVVGDMSSDIELARRCGAQSVLVQTGAGGKDGLYEGEPDITLGSLAELPEKLPPAEVTESSDAKPVILRPGELQTIGHVTGKIGHDFNNLIGSVMGGIDLVRGRAAKHFAGENPFERPLGIMQDAVQKAIALTSKLRSYPRPGHYEIARVDVRNIVSNAVMDAQKLYGKDIEEINVTIPDGLAVAANGFALTRIIFHFIENAIQARKPNKKARIEIKAEALSKRNVAQISVADEGRGLTPAQKSRGFTPFASSKGGVGYGYGLSLAMAKLSLTQCHGDVRLISEEGQGTTITVELPLAAAS